MRDNRSTQQFDRRTTLKTLGALAIAGGGLAGVSTKGSARPVGSDSAAGESFVRVGVNTFDNDDTGADVRIVRTSDPEVGGGVTYATSGGTRTTDYATSVLSVPDVALGDLTELTYEYYGGAQNLLSAPDEVWALLRDADGNHHAVFRHASDSNPSGQTWRTRDVLAEIRGESSLSPDTSWATLVEGSSGRGQVKSLQTSLVATFGAGAVLRRVGVGRGRTGGDGTVADVFYRNLRLNGSRLDAFPASNAEIRADDAEQRLSKEVIVSAPGTDELFDYVFEVTGDLEKLEPNEDTVPAVDEVSRQGDRVRVEGTVGSGDDRFTFSGNLVEIDVPPAVQLDIRSR
jgi:hypothetical protein